MSRFLNQGKAPKDDGIAIGRGAEKAGYLPTKVGRGVKIQGYELPSDDEIVWSDEEDPEADIGFDKAFKARPKRRTEWGKSLSRARRESMVSGKPILLWFTNLDRKAPNDVALTRQVFSDSDFRKWARKNVLRVQVDVSGGTSGLSKLNDRQTRVDNYIEDLKKRYKVNGVPCLVVLAPSGQVTTQIRGYRRDGQDAYRTKLEDQVATIKTNEKFWRGRMQKKGYRLWTGSNGLQLFAKLARFNQGELTLVEPTGRKLKTKVSQLSALDKAWIEAEKAKSDQRKAALAAR